MANIRRLSEKTRRKAPGLISAAPIIQAGGAEACGKLSSARLLAGG